VHAVEEAVDRREVPHADVGTQPVGPRSLLVLDAPQPLQAGRGGHDQAGPPMARVVDVVHEAGRLEGIGDPLDALAGEAQHPGDLGYGSRLVLDCRQHLPARGRLAGRPGQRVPLVLEEPVEPEHADDEGAERVAGRGPRWPSGLEILDSMLSIRYCTHDSIMSYRRTADVDCRLELIAVPVSDVDRAIAFYRDQVGFNLDYDHKVSPELRFVQLTPRGSACSIAIGVGVTPAEPGSVVGMQVVVDDAAAAREDLVAHGVEASEVETFPWGRFTFFADPDGNRWAVQEIIRPS
jgi:predicted enzyme related to lactoylglutathione lyase